MLTIKKDGKRIVNPELTPPQYMGRGISKESLFKTLVAECGFMPSHRKEVWTHTKDELFSTQLFSEDNAIFFEYQYRSDSYVYDSNITNKEFISYFLDESRNFFKMIKECQNAE